VASNGNAGPLEFPASLAFSGSNLYASNFDIERGANSPAAPGIGASIAQLAVGVTGFRPPVIGDAVSATAPPQVTPVALTPTTEVVDHSPVPPVVEPEVTPVGMPRTGGSDSLLWPLLAGLSGLLLLVGALARRPYASKGK
jgi:hypothetical protein